MSLNPKQKSAVSCDDHCLVVACPGSGKSKVVVSKVEDILNKNHDANIVVTTFSREGANELKDRLKLILTPEQFKHVYVSTFHALALAHLKREKISLRIAKDTNEYLLRALEHTGIDISFEEAGKLLQNCKTTPNYVPRTDTEDDIYAGKIYKEYQSICKKNNVIDFYDIMNMSLERINAGSMPILNATHMLVDEFQDCDEIQYQYMMAHVKSGKVKVTCVGDDDQAIYAFRNSLGYEGMFRFEKEANATRIVLDTNYRCRKEILTPAERLIRFNGSRMDKQLKSARGTGGSVTYVRLASKEAESMALCEKIVEVSFKTNLDNFSSNRDLFPPDLDGKEWAVLARNNILLESVDALCKEFSIPTIKNFKPIWERKPVSLMLSLMKSFDSKEKTNIDHLLHWYGMEQEDLNTLYLLLNKDYSNLFDKKFNINIKTEKLSKLGSTKLKRFIADLNGWAKGNSRADEQRTDSVIASIGSWMISSSRKSIEKERLHIAISVLLKLKGSMLERVAFVTSGDKSADGRGVQLMTMHGSKGLEFDNVWVIRAEADIIPSTANLVLTERIVEEERRLMYVAMTRAKNHLYITSTSQNPASVFIKEANLKETHF